MPGLMTIGSSRRLELTDGEQVLFVESSSSPMLEAAGSRPASQLTKAKRRVMSVTSEAQRSLGAAERAPAGDAAKECAETVLSKVVGDEPKPFLVFSLSFFNGFKFIYFLVPVF